MRQVPQPNKAGHNTHGPEDDPLAPSQAEHSTRAGAATAPECDGVGGSTRPLAAQAEFGVGV